MQKLSKTLAALLGLSIVLLGWAIMELMRARENATIAMQQVEMANQRIDSIVEQIHAQDQTSAQT